MAMRLVSPITIPEKPDIREKQRIAGMRIFRCPTLSEILPLIAAKIPQAIPITATRFPIAS
jgi:hypothetical protein